MHRRLQSVLDVQLLFKVEHEDTVHLETTDQEDVLKCRRPGGGQFNLINMYSYQNVLKVFGDRPDRLDIIIIDSTESTGKVKPG